MAYEVFKTKLNKEDYFNYWGNQYFNSLGKKQKNLKYKQYLVKCDVLERDNYTCQNMNCKYCNNIKEFDNLTVHHVKWQKNGGHNKVRNEVILCEKVHQKFHKAKEKIVFENNSNLPPHIRGHTFKLDKPDNEGKKDWVKARREAKAFRKTLRDQCGIKLSWEQIYYLMQWLEMSDCY